MFPIILRGHPVQKWFHNYACVAVASIDDSMFVVFTAEKHGFIMHIMHVPLNWGRPAFLFKCGRRPSTFLLYGNIHSSKGTFIVITAARCMITPEKRSKAAWCRVQTCRGLAHSHTRNNHKNSSLFCRNRYLFTNPLRLKAKFRYKYDLMMNS